MSSKTALPILKIAIHATPSAKTTQAAGAYGDALRVRLAAPPVDGKANAELLAWAAQTFGVTKDRVEIANGAGGRHKLLAISLPDAAALAAAQELLAHLREQGQAS